MPLALAEIEVSTDNSTWVDATYYGLEVYIENGTILIDGLDAETTYYIRGRNSTHNWTYLSAKTEEGGINKVPIAVILGLISITAFLIYLAISLKEEKYLPIRILFLFVSLFLILISLNVASSIAVDETYQANITMAYQICLWSFVFVMGYFIIIFIRETVLSTREKKRKRMEGEE